MAIAKKLDLNKPLKIRHHVPMKGKIGEIKSAATITITATIPCRPLERGSRQEVRKRAAGGAKRTSTDSLHRFTRPPGVYQRYLVLELNISPKTARDFRNGLTAERSLCIKNVTVKLI
jgi:hypothetical protein